MANATGADKANELRERGQKLLTLDYFAALGVAQAPTPDDVRKAFLEAVKLWHPDRVPAGLDDLRPLFSKIFARLELARATLSDSARRLKYIEDLKKQATAATSGDVSAAEANVEFKKAEAFLKKNDAAQAEIHLRRAVQIAPANVAYQALLVWLQAKPDTNAARLRELIADLDRLIKQDDACERAYFYRGQLRKRADVPGANDDFTRAAELNPSNVDAAREVRLHKMRQDKAAGGDARAGTKGTESADGESGVGGFFRKLFKR